MRYSRLAQDLKITDDQRDKYLVRPGDKFTDYIRTTMPEKDARSGSARRRPTCRWWRVRAAPTGCSTS